MISKVKNPKIIPDNIDILLEMKNKEVAFGIPTGKYEDEFIIAYARNHNAYILSNDRYNDIISSDKLSIKDRELLKQYIRNNTIGFAFIKDEFIPDPEFLKAKNITH